VSKLWDILSGVYLWTSSLLILAKLFEGSVIQGTMIVWAVGIPFLITILLT